MRWGNLLSTVAPIAVSFIPGVGIPAAIALGAGTGGLTSALQGKKWSEILRDTALGGASGAAGAAIGGSVAKGAQKMSEKAMAEGAEAIASNALSSGTGFATDAVVDAAKTGAKKKFFDSVYNTTKGALGKDAEKTEDMLNLVGKGGKVVTAVDSFFQSPEQSARFSSMPGFDPLYQYGQSMRTPSFGSEFGTAVVRRRRSSGGLY